MTKKELKKMFDEELNQITVSNDLKEKTLQKIEKEKSQNVYSFPYLKNVCAIFIVSLICFCVYINKDNLYLYKDNGSESSLIENTNNVNDSITESLATEKQLKTRTFSVEEDNYSEILKNEVLLDKNITLNEEEFVSRNPEAKKTNRGYILKENGVEKIYVFKDGNLIEILEN